jgi:Flp pilus assembly protein TadG
MAQKSSAKRGVVLLSCGVCVVGLFGMAGLAIDIGRLYTAKNEAQGYADAAAIAAAQQLDGTAAGVTNADIAASASTNKWNFNTAGFSGTVVEYSTDGSTGWTASGAAAPANLRFVRVTATINNVSLYFLPIIGTGSVSTVRTAAVAGQQLTASLANGIFPYSPIAHVMGSTAAAVFAADPTHNFGFTVGQQYDLKWPANAAVGSSGANKVPCDGDNAAAWVNRQNGSGPEIGEIMLQSASALRSVIDDLSGVNITLDQSVGPTNGDKNSIVQALNDRIAMDGNTTALDYGAYIADTAHNGRRLVTVVVNSGWADTSGAALPAAQQSQAVGFAQFLLLPSYVENGGGNNPWCAIYVGPDPLNGANHKGGGGNNGQGVAFVRLTL